MFTRCQIVGTHVQPNTAGSDGPDCDACNADGDGGEADVLPEAGRGRAKHRGQTRDPVKVGGRIE